MFRKQRRCLAGRVTSTKRRLSYWKMWPCSVFPLTCCLWKPCAFGGLLGAYQGGQFAAIVGGAVGLVGQHQQQALLIAGSLQAAQVCQPFGQPLILCHGCVSLCDGGSHFTRKVAGARRLRYPSVLRKARLVVSRQAEKRAAYKHAGADAPAKHQSGPSSGPAKGANRV